MTCIDESTKVQFLALNKKSAWDEGIALDVKVSDNGIELARHLEYATGKTITWQDLGGMVEIKDLAIGACNLLYVLGMLDQTTPSICTYDRSQDLTERLEGDNLYLHAPTSIALAPGILYIAYEDGKQRIVAVARPENEITVVSGPELPELKLPFMPIDLVVDSTGDLFALDPNNHVIVRFSVKGGTPKIYDNKELSEITPAALAVSPDGFLYVLDRVGRKVVKLGTTDEARSVNLVELVSLVNLLPPAFEPAGLAVDAEGGIYIGDGRDQPARSDEDDRFLHKFDANINYWTPIAGFRGKASLIAIDRTNRMYLLTQSELSEHQQIVVLEPTVLKPKRSIVAHGSYYSRAFDSAASGTRWHRLILEATIPANTQVIVAHYVADQPRTKEEISGLKDKDWINPTTFRAEQMDENAKASEFTTLIRQNDLRPSGGRYLWLKLTLVGGEQFTPAVRSVCVCFPRSSYLRYLPAVYQHDEPSRDFLERFLSLFETLFADIEHKIDTITRYFDGDAVPPDFLSWLASWLAIAVDEHWLEQQVRNLIKLAPTLFQQRGTRAGIEAMVKVFTNQPPFILEQFQLPSVGIEEKTLKRLYPSYPNPYCFYVFLRPDQAKQEPERTMVRRLVESEKPAHTYAHIQDLEPRIFLDGHTYLEVNTCLSEPPVRLDMGVALSIDARLTDCVDS